MKKSVFLFLGLFLSFPCLSVAGLGDLDVDSDFAPLPLILKEEAVIVGDKIRLSDLFDGLEEGRGNKTVANAPALGKSVVLNGEWLKKAAQRAGASWKPSASENNSITVIREAKIFHTKDIKERVLEALNQKGVSKESEVVFSPLSETEYLTPADGRSVIALENLIQGKDGSFSGKVQIRSGDRVFYAVSVSGRIYETVFIPVLKDSLMVGQIVSEDALELIPVRPEQLRGKVLVSAEDIIGKEAKKTLKAGSPLMSEELKSPLLVSKGKIATLSFLRANVSLSAQVKVLDNGSWGDTVRVLNPQSKTVLQAKVAGLDHLVIPSPSAQIQ